VLEWDRVIGRLSVPGKGFTLWGVARCHSRWNSDRVNDDLFRSVTGEIRTAGDNTPA
jgi:hypothetical protein